MASVSSSNTSTLLPSWPSESNSTSFRDVSFSSYLNSSEETYIRTLAETSQRKLKPEDVEIDVFTADKYFNGAVEDDDDDVSESSVSVRKQYDQRNQARTSSNQSESSSWNSQSALLRRVQRVPSRGSSNISSKVQGKKSFLSYCSCCVNSSVDVENELVMNQVRKDDVGFRSVKTSLDVAEITRMNKLRLDREQPDPFFFPQVSDSPANNKSVETNTRKSIEVFGSNDMDDHHGIIQRRLNMLSWDAIPRIQTTASESSPHSESYKDTESDASSDLFEIECLSCTANPVVVGPTRPSEGCATPTTCYAPSEASIEWSVVTASAADFSAAVSDTEDQTSSITSVTRRRAGPAKIKKGGMLLGCKSQKAVRVAGEVYRKPVVGKEKFEVERRHRRNSDSFIGMSMTRSQGEDNKLAAGIIIGQKQRKQGVVVAQGSPRWSHSSHGSEIMYIQ